MSDEELVEETQVEIEARLKSEIAEELKKITDNLSKEGSYVNITQDIANGLLTISVTPRTVNDGTFDKVMDRVEGYVNLYAEKIALTSSEEKQIPKDVSIG